MKEPSRYIKNQEELRELLAILRHYGATKLFLTTSSHIEFTQLIMETTLGEDWIEFFDLVVCNARKPLFYRGQEEFKSIDGNTKEIATTV